MSLLPQKRLDFDPSFVDKNWNESELSDFWMSDILKSHGWGTSSIIKSHIKKEVKSSHRDRLDFGLYINDRIVACVELKSPKDVDLKNPEKRRVSLCQASKYALSKFRYHHGSRIAPLGVLTNGFNAYIFDGSRRFEDVLQFHKSLDLRIKADLIEFLSVFSHENFDLLKAHSTHPIIRLPIEENSGDIIGSADHQLSKDIINLYRNIEKHIDIPTENVAFLGTISLFILSVFRDCGLYPNLKIQELANKKDRNSWEIMIDDLSKIMNDDLSILKTPYCEAAWNFYEDTTWLCVNLSTFPAAGLGRAYEDLLQAVSAKNSTTFYTPDELVSSILDISALTPTDKILDPTCGSGAFLASAIEKVFSEQSFSHKEARDYIQSKVWGVDKDWFACQIAKVSIIAVYAKSIKYSEEAANKFKAPKLNIIHDDFFSIPEKEKFDVIVGNPPWGSADIELDRKFEKEIKSYRSYCDKTDICIYVVEKAWRLLAPGGRFGLLCKREVLEGGQHKNHRITWEGLVEEVWDFGKKKLFHNNGALTIALIGKSFAKASPIIVTKDPSAVRKKFSYPGIDLGEMFDIFQGFASGDDKVFRELAKAFPKHSSIRREVADRDLEAFKVHAGRPTFFLNRQDLLPIECRKYLEKTIFVKTLRKSKNRPGHGEAVNNNGLWFLLNRANCLRGKAYEGWSWVYREGLNAGSLVMPRYVRGERCRAAYLPIHSATMTNLSVLKPRSLSINVFWTLAFLNSKAAIDVISNTVKFAGGGDVVAAFPEYLNKIKVPQPRSELLERHVTKLSTLMTTRDLPPSLLAEGLEAIDQVFEKLTSSEDATKSFFNKAVKNITLINERIEFICNRNNPHFPIAAHKMLNSLENLADTLLSDLKTSKAKLKR